jgi:hypothetical protein
MLTSADAKADPPQGQGYVPPVNAVLNLQPGSQLGEATDAGAARALQASPGASGACGRRRWMTRVKRSSTQMGGQPVTQTRQRSS